MQEFNTVPEELIAALLSAQHVAVLTGAGTSAESGVPTFREAQQGLWAQYDPQELATPQAFRSNPALVWEWYTWRRGLVAAAEPNAGHRALAELADLVPRLTLITQNVDSMHQRAGSPDVIELHGNINRTICSADGRTISDWDEDSGTPPLCPLCRSLLRPDVVWFGETLPQPAVSRAFDAAGSCDLFLTVGTSGIVHPAASLPLKAIERRVLTVEINPAPTPLSTYMDLCLRGPSGTMLPELIALLRHARRP